MNQISKVFKVPPKQFPTIKANGGKKLSLLNDYFAIGFDVDHCLVRYQAKEIFPILCNSLYKVLIDKKGYPENMFEFNTFERNFFMNGLVIDLRTGNILKLGVGKVILRACFGLEMLSQTQIQKEYGCPPIYEVFEANNPFTEDYFCCLSFFECYFPLVFAKIVDYKRQGKGSLSRQEIKGIMDDAFYAVEVNYSHSNEQLYQPILEFGHYYKSVINNIDKVLCKQEKMLSSLQRLKEKGKVLFLVSDSHYEYVGSLMEHVYGNNWLELFDYALLNAKKPSFFQNRTRLFREIDISKPNRMGPEVNKLEKNQMYTAGNAELLEKNIRDALEKPQDGKILYFGDHYCYDILASKDIANWDRVCIMEELEGLDLGDDYDGRIWGNWQYEETPEGVIPTFWFNEMMNAADKCTAAVNSEEMLEFYNQEDINEKKS